MPMFIVQYKIFKTVEFAKVDKVILNNTITKLVEVGSRIKQKVQFIEIEFCIWNVYISSFGDVEKKNN